MHNTCVQQVSFSSVMGACYLTQTTKMQLRPALTVSEIGKLVKL